jgi:hypothetical protein
MNDTSAAEWNATLSNLLNVSYYEHPNHTSVEWDDLNVEKSLCVADTCLILFTSGSPTTHSRLCRAEHNMRHQCSPMITAPSR